MEAHMLPRGDFMRRVLRGLFRLLLLVLAICLLAFLLFRSKYQVAIRDLAETQVKNSTSDLINDAIDNQIET